ncbi:MAG: LLM class flavin-dependent oxidoreductase [Actinobacteria bacterium]|nr:LLM class flavin-dependent oxidoreductase [Actinomycetota bacterium]
MTGGFGVFLPTFCGPEGRSGAEISAFSRRAEELGFDSLWATDHLLHGSLFYREPWLDPVVSLSFAAAVTSRVQLGTSIIVMPTRNPILFAKELSTLQALSGERFILGVGTGWDAREFDAVGVRKSERGRRTDDALEIVRRLLAGERVSHDGRFHRFEGVEVGPPMREPLKVWVAGGRQLAHPTSPEPPVLAPPVLERIASADGWIARPTAAPDQIKEDLDEILSFLQQRGRDPEGFTVAHENFLHLVPTEDPAEAEREQRQVFSEVMGERRPFEYFQQVYLTGTLEEILHKIDERIAAGVQHFMFHTLEPSTRQLELWVEHVMPRIGRNART